MEGDSHKDGAQEANYCIGATDTLPDLVRYHYIHPACVLARASLSFIVFLRFLKDQRIKFYVCLNEIHSFPFPLNSNFKPSFT